MKRDTSECYENCDRKAFFAREYQENIDFEQVEEFYEFLQGNREETDYTVPAIFREGLSWTGKGKITWRPEDIPHLSKEQAFAVIYYLQEALFVLPDTYEKCRECGDLYDDGCGGCIAGYCDGCGCQVEDYDNLEDGCEDCPLRWEEEDGGDK
jgi:hypothetical protein